MLKCKRAKKSVKLQKNYLYKRILAVVILRSPPVGSIIKLRPAYKAIELPCICLVVRVMSIFDFNRTSELELLKTRGLIGPIILMAICMNE